MTGGDITNYHLNLTRNNDRQRIGQSSGIFYDESGNIIGELGLEQPLIDPVDIIAGMGSGYIKWTTRPFWQYYPANNPAYSSRWLTRRWGWKPPYKAGTAAQEALNLPPWNPGTAVRPFYPKWYKPVVGPRTPMPQPKWGWPSPGDRWSEYFYGWRFPD